MPGAVTVTEGPTRALVECHLCGHTAEASTAAEADVLVVDHLDTAHPEVADD